MARKTTHVAKSPATDNVVRAPLLCRWSDKGGRKRIDRYIHYAHLNVHQMLKHIVFNQKNAARKKKWAMIAETEKWTWLVRSSFMDSRRGSRLPRRFSSSLGELFFPRSSRYAGNNASITGGNRQEAIPFSDPFSKKKISNNYEAIAKLQTIYIYHQREFRCRDMKWYK